MRAFIFDMDGVIVDSELHWKSVEGFFLQSLIPGWGSADQGRIIGLSQDDLYTLLTTEYGLQHDKDLFHAEYREMAHRIYAEKVSLIEGFPEVLGTLQDIQVPLGLASSSPRSWISIVLDRFNLRDAFKVVVSAEEVDGPGKPAPDIYLHTAERLSVSPGRCVAVEDSKNGVLSVKSAGMYCIGLRNGFNDEQDLSAADQVINSFTELDRAALDGLLS